MLNKLIRNACLGLAALLAVLGAQEVATAAPAWTTFQNTNKTDALGCRWDIRSGGYIDDGTNNSLSNALTLIVNGNGFGAHVSQMSADGTNYQFTNNNMNGLQVRRYVHLDLKASVANYLESFTNLGPQPVQANIQLRTQLNRAQAQSLVTNSGTPLVGMLGKKDNGFLVYSAPNTQQVSVVIYCGGGSKVQPTVANNSNTNFVVSYVLTVPPGKTVSLVHGLAQRRLAAPPTGRDLKDLFKPFSSRRWLSQLPRELRQNIVNSRGSRLPAFDSIGFDSLDTLDVELGARDVLAIGDATRLSGRVSCAGIQLELDGRQIDVPLERVAAIVGGAHESGRPRLYLRDGQIFSGQFQMEELRMTLSSGLEMELDQGKLDRLVLREAPVDGQPVSKIDAMVQTNDGQRLAVIASPEGKLNAITAWGRRTIPLTQLLSCQNDEDAFGYRLVLSDGTRLFAHLAAEPLVVQTEFGKQQLATTDLHSWLAVNVTKDQVEDVGKPKVPHVVLTGENVLVGRIDVDVLHLRTDGQSIPVAPSQIRVLRNQGESSEPRHQSKSVFEAELWDGGIVFGTIDPLLPIREQDGVTHVRAMDVLEVHVPTPTVPDSLRPIIAKHIQGLGSDDFRGRENAQQALADLGYLARPQLEEVQRQTQDAEVRRRVEDLLSELD